MSATASMSELAALTGVTRDMIRDRINKGGLPWEDSKEPEKHRRYTGFHVLALLVAKMLEAQGLSVAMAAEAVQAQKSTIDRFFAGGAQEQLFVAVMSQAIEVPDGPLRWVPTIYWGYGTPDELRDLVAAAIAQTGTISGTGSRYVGGPALHSVMLGEAYRIAQIRAAQSDFMLDGTEIHRTGAKA